MHALGEHHHHLHRESTAGEHDLMGVFLKFLAIAWLGVAASASTEAAAASVAPPTSPPETLRSFEEWRIHNLLQSGQDIGVSGGVGSPNNGHGSGEDGDGPARDSETDPVDPFTGEIDFHLFSGSDDSGKTYKDRFNYASFDCGATVVKSNKDVKGAGAILVENKDSYLLNKCSAGNKHVIIELCQDILVDQVVLGNYEFFSSMFRDIRISVADRYPVATGGEWKVLGEFTAANVRDLQNFNISVSLIWARYVKIEFLSYWGHEYYCPVSVVRVHGTTMMEEWKRGGGHETASAATSSGKEEIKEGEQAPEDTQESVFDQDNGGEDDGSDVKPPPPSLNHTIIEKGECPPKLALDKVKLGLNEYCRLDEFYRSHRVNSTHSNSTNSNSTNSSASSSSSSPSYDTPATQESIYKTIMKRLSLLESNATLSLQYVEEQSKVLRDLLYKIEKKQNSKIDDFLHHFNATVLQQLVIFSHQRESKLHKAVVELDSQKTQSDKNMAAISQRFALLADDLVFQKRMSMFQGLILLVVLLFVALTRGTGPEYTALASDSDDNSEFVSLRKNLRRNLRRNLSELSPRWSLNLTPHSPASDDYDDGGLDSDSQDELLGGSGPADEPPLVLGSPLTTPGPKKKKSRSLYDEPVRWEEQVQEDVEYISPAEEDLDVNKVEEKD